MVSARSIGKMLLQCLVIAAIAAQAHSQLQGTSSASGGAPTDLSDCDVAIVGGGISGVYSAYRLLETNASTSVCLFEATGRLGGRIYSVHNLGPNRDLTLDMGAYRYMPLNQPLITDLIQQNLMLPNRLYQPAVQQYKIILTPDGSNAGFATFVTALAAKAVDMGLELNYNSRVVRMYAMEDGTFTLQTSAGRNITADSVILNLPSRPLHRLMQASGFPTAGTEVNQEMQETYQNRATKLYLYYDNAWWLAAGLNNGSLAYNLPWNVTQPPKVPVIGRYHDGHQKCATMASMGSVSASSVSSPQYVDYYYTNANGLNTNMCYGFIQHLYTSDSGTTNISHYPLDYMVDYSSPTPGPDGIALPYTVWDNTTAMGQKLLNDSHMQLVAYQSSVNRALNGSAATTLPTLAVVALWDASVDWSGGGWHTNKTNRAGEPEWSEAIIKPFDDYDLYIADEAYSPQYGWAEGGLIMAENIMRRYFGATTPSWMNETTAAASIFGATYSDSESVAQGGGTGMPMAPLQGNFPTGSGLAPTPSRY